MHTHVMLQVSGLNYILYILRQFYIMTFKSSPYYPLFKKRVNMNYGTNVDNPSNTDYIPYQLLIRSPTNKAVLHQIPSL